uniref:OCRE domain-containing protein n=1 Tax=Leersia perrieri TaxID=77586 RepID=A0A0D9XD45_9ORYZ
MEPPRGTKRPLPTDAGASAGDDDDDGALPGERKPRFPKGKKAKYRDPAAAAAAEGIDGLINPELAAERRARRRHRKEDDDQQGAASDVRGFEVRYEDGTNLVDDGIRLEPFNLEQEREEGYFDENGNFVEFARSNDIKDAWLDSVEVDPKYAEKIQKKKEKEKQEEFEDLSSDDIGKIKRRIANMLEPGETIIQALKRLKGTSSDKRGKMSEGTKRIFDELTEAAMKLMENGEYNVYSDDRETFEREAAGYERLARARLGLPEPEEDIFADSPKDKTTALLLDMEPGPSAASTSTTTTTSKEDDGDFDMFGDDDDKTDANRESDGNAIGSGSNPEQVPHDANETSEGDNGSVGSDYIYDPTSGYYYSSSTGYYYDSTSGCYCSASTGTWYSYDEQSGEYKEIQSEQPGTGNDTLGNGIKE